MLYDFPQDWIYSADDLKSVDAEQAAVHYLADKVSSIESSMYEDPQNAGTEIKILNSLDLNFLDWSEIVDTILTWITRIGAVGGLLFLLKQIRAQDITIRRPRMHLPQTPLVFDNSNTRNTAV